jgi:hypothetical protein
VKTLLPGLEIPPAPEGKIVKLQETMAVPVLPHGPFHVHSKGKMLKGFGVKLQTETGNRSNAVFRNVSYVVRDVGAYAQYRPQGLPSGGTALHREDREGKNKRYNKA